MESNSGFTRGNIKKIKDDESKKLMESEKIQDTKSEAKAILDDVDFMFERAISMATSSIKGNGINYHPEEISSLIMNIFDGIGEAIGERNAIKQRLISKIREKDNGQ